MLPAQRSPWQIAASDATAGSCSTSHARAPARPSNPGSSCSSSANQRSSPAGMPCELAHQRPGVERVQTRLRVDGHVDHPPEQAPAGAHQLADADPSEQGRAGQALASRRSGDRRGARRRRRTRCAAPGIPGRPGHVAPWPRGARDRRARRSETDATRADRPTAAARPTRRNAWFSVKKPPVKRTGASA